MFNRKPCDSKIIPKEFRSAAEKLFPPGGSGNGGVPSIEAAAVFAKVLGIGEDYKRLWKVHESGEDMGEFLNHFQNNLDLLIQKTWVEKADEDRKDALQDKVPSLIALIETGDYSQALKEFGGILEELAYLFFGTQSQKDDFDEYVFRIDPHIGLFWWYGGRLGGELIWKEGIDKNVHFALLLLGICYLTDF